MELPEIEHGKSKEIPAIIVDSMESLQSFLQEVIEQLLHPIDTHTLYLDLQGKGLTRNGTLSVLTLLINGGSCQPERAYLLDIHTLGSSAFTTPVNPPHFGNYYIRNHYKTLKDLLEASHLVKVIFGIDDLFGALFRQFGIRVQRVTDLQLMENVAREGNSCSKRPLYDLSKCIAEDPNFSEDQKRTWLSVKEEGGRLYDPQMGGGHYVFEKRPLASELKQYCEQNVRYLPVLYGIYEQNWPYDISRSRSWTTVLELETNKRLNESMTATDQPHQSHQASDPDWNDYYARDGGEEDSDWDWDDMGASDCPGYEDDMEKNGEF